MAGWRARACAQIHEPCESEMAEMRRFFLGACAQNKSCTGLDVVGNIGTMLDLYLIQLLFVCRRIYLSIHSLM